LLLFLLPSFDEDSFRFIHRIMKTAALHTFEPRKTPVQNRSTVTVKAIAEAAIQVLLAVGLNRLTTTRVADREGVSVGTLYQYYPNKQALLRRLSKRVHRALTAALADAAGPTLGDTEFAALILYSAMAGATRAMLEAGAPLARGVAGALPGVCGEVGGVKLKIRVVS
jgi:AcrR family transcriptional regulator